MLIIAVALIWGVVLYKFIAPYFAKQSKALVMETPTEPSLLRIKKKDTLNLSFPTRDPFLGKSAIKRKPKAQKKTTSVRRPSTIAKPILWPKIKYLGFVKSSNSKNRLALVRIDGKLYRVKKNESVAGLKIKNISGEELLILNGKEEKSFSKN